jgi:hypothetical protein
VRLRKFAIRSFCRSAQVKTEEGTSPSIYHLSTIHFPSHWMVSGGGGGLYQGARSGSELIAVTLASQTGRLSALARGISSDGRSGYGTLEGYLKVVDVRSSKNLYKFKTPSGIIGNVMTYEHRGKQYVAVLSGVGGWAGVGLTAGLTHSGEGANSPKVYAAPIELHGARRTTHGFRFAMTPTAFATSA